MKRQGSKRGFMKTAAIVAIAAALSASPARASLTSSAMPDIMPTKQVEKAGVCVAGTLRSIQVAAAAGSVESALLERCP